MKNFFQSNLNKNEKKNEYDYLDAGSAIVGATLTPQVIGVVFVLLFMLIASISNIAYADLIKSYPGVITLLLSGEIGFVIFFICYNKKLNINYIKACNLNKNFKWYYLIATICISLICLFLFNPIINCIDIGLNTSGYLKSSDLPYKINNAWLFITSLIVMAIIPAIVEELLFRGLIFNGLNNAFKKDKKYSILAIIISALIFALIHLSLRQLVYPFVLGIISTIIYIMFGNLWYSIIFHFLNNATVVLISFIQELNGGVNGIDVQASGIHIIFALLWAVTAIVLIMAILIIVKKLPKFIKNKKGILLEKSEYANINTEELESDEKQVKKMIELTEKELCSTDDAVVNIDELEKVKSLRKSGVITKLGSGVMLVGLSVLIGIWVYSIIMGYVG